ncbi:MAG TPA: TPM domain-containing protein [Bacteroidales bacterium]
MSIKSILTLSLFLFYAINLCAVETGIPPRPEPPRLINDLSGLLSKSQSNSLETKLRAFNDTTSNQITIVIVNSLNNYDPASFAYAIGEEWGVGQKKFDNGIVVLVKPKTSESDRGKAYIAVGYGLEPVITDALAKRIVENEMIPNFQQNNYYQGLDQATDVLMQLASGEISEEGYNKSKETSGIVAIIPFIIILLIFILIRASGSRSHSVGKNVPFWTALWLASSLGGRKGGHWGGFSGGSGGFGGGGGGFGGFGGGSFGGGGAGGSW